MQILDDRCADGGIIKARYFNNMLLLFNIMSLQGGTTKQSRSYSYRGEREEIAVLRNDIVVKSDQLKSFLSGNTQFAGFAF